MNTIEFLLICSLLGNAFIGLVLLAVAIVLKVLMREK